MFMYFAKIMAHGQITIPAQIRKKLGVNAGDDIAFIEESGRVIMETAAMAALKDAQDAFAGEAELLGVKTEQSVVDMVKEVRSELWKDRHVDHD